MVAFGEEFVKQNQNELPKNSIVFEGYKGDLGAGYDGQIFYFYSRAISNLSFNWPQGFEESFRAPRIGYPFLVSIFGLVGKDGNLFGLFFVNLSLIFLSFLCLKKILKKENQNLAYFYLFSPFIFGSYAFLVSDAVMVSLVIMALYFYEKKNFLLFSGLGGLSILTKEPALFLFFPLGILAILNKNIKYIFICASVLILPILWNIYLYLTLPSWNPSRMTDFIVPFDGIYTYLTEIYNFIMKTQEFSFKKTARLFSKIPLLLLTYFMFLLILQGNYKKAIVYRIGLIMNLFIILNASYYHFWSVYENISRMFVMSVPLVILWKNEDNSVKDSYFHLTTLLILFLFFIKHLFVTSVLSYKVL